MSQFQEKLKLFEIGIVPPLKPKPKHLQSIPRSPLLNSDSQSNIANTNITDELRKEVNDGAYEFCGSLYDLPGLEIFNFDVTIEDEDKYSSPVEDTVTDESRESCNVQKEEKLMLNDDNVLLAPSQNLINEMFKSSIWRNSENFSDDFIFAPPRISVPATMPSHVERSVLPPEDAQLPARRSLFNIFRSKKGQKKSSEKLFLKDNSDSDSLQDTISKKKSNDKNHFENKTKSMDRPKTKPLNSIVDRDWLNSIGDGVTKKATVMSELKRLFRHGKFKKFKKKSGSFNVAAKTETSKKKNENKKAVIDDIVYDDDVDEDLSTILEKTNRDKNQVHSDKAETNSIYDVGEVDEGADDVEQESFFYKQRHDYDGPNDINEIYAEEDTPCLNVTESHRISNDESIYDEGEEIEEADKREINDKVSVDDATTPKSQAKTIVEKKKTNAFKSIFSPKQSLSNDKSDDVLKKNTHEVEDFNKKTRLDKNEICVDKPKETINKVSENMNKKKNFDFIKTKEVNKQEDVYDDDVEDVKINFLDKGNEMNIKEIVGDKKVLFNEAFVDKKKAFPKKNDLSKYTNIVSDIYDEDNEEVEEYASDVDDTSIIVEVEKKIGGTKTEKLGDLKENISNKSLGIHKSRVGFNKVSIKMVHSNSDVYDEDIEVVEEYASDIENGTSIKEEVKSPTTTEVKWPINSREIISKNIVEKPIKKIIINSVGVEENVSKGLVYEKQSKINEVLSKKLINTQNKNIFAKSMLPKVAKNQLDEYDEDCGEVKQKDVKDELKNVKKDAPTKSVVKETLGKFSKSPGNQKFDPSDIYDQDVDLEVNFSKTTENNSRKCDVRTEIRSESKKYSTVSKNSATIPNQNQTTGADVYDVEDEEPSQMVAFNSTLETEDEELQKLIKRNLKVAKKTFKLKEPILSVAKARAIKTVYLESKTNIPFNIGEHLEIIEYRKDMALVKNGVGKCGLTSTCNLHIIKES